MPQNIAPPGLISFLPPHWHSSPQSRWCWRWIAAARVFLVVIKKLYLTTNRWVLKKVIHNKPFALGCGLIRKTVLLTVCYNKQENPLRR